MTNYIFFAIIYLQNKSIFNSKAEQNMKKIKEFLKSFSFGTLFCALIFIALGISLLIWKEPASKLVCMVFGGVLIINALVQLVLVFKDKTFGFGNPLMMFSSLIMAVIGAWMLTGPAEVSSAIIFIILSVLLLYHGLMDMKFSFYLKGATHKLWYIALLIGFVTIGTGVLSLVCYSEAWLSAAVGASLIFDGLSDIWIVWIMAATKRGTSKMTEVIETDAKEIVEAE